MAWRSVAATAAWVCAVAAAGGLGAWSLANADTGGRNARAVPLDDGGVREKLAAARAASPGPSSGTPSGPAATGSPGSPPGVPSGSASGSRARPAGGGTVRLAGGSATAECRTDGRIHLTVWSPATGYRADDVRRGPAATAAIEFEPLDDHSGDDHTYTLRCTADGRPQAVPAPDDDDDDD
ncbi:hypothetical protein [Streptomyces sp. NPDC059788]|uniref:hypothetical protein n=1 Tax=Streptomyces sp. NPDC059788 TaxID=3346948 RepID=UPI00364D7613